MEGKMREIEFFKRIDVNKKGKKSLIKLFPLMKKLQKI